MQDSFETSVTASAAACAIEDTLHSGLRRFILSISAISEVNKNPILSPGMAKSFVKASITTICFSFFISSLRLLSSELSRKPTKHSSIISLISFFLHMSEVSLSISSGMDIPVGFPGLQRKRAAFFISFK